ncbi:MAG TPA: ABC transporter permease [Puia sp.]|jgi:putative ABC transport system permease protein|nr:ABC transporter permease [Puia sp.]
MKIIDTFLLAIRTVRGNKLRTGITVAIIAFGIMALVGINTAIEAMKQKFTESFSSMGANGFTIHYRQFNVNFSGNSDVKKEKKGARKEKKSNSAKPITKMEAEEFKSRFDYPAKICLTIGGARDAVVSLADKKTNPTVRINGGDENYSDLNGYSLAAGRELNNLDVQSGRNVCVIGSDIAKKFFGTNPETAIEKIIKINNIPYRVVGTLASKGSTLGFSWDNMILTSYNNVRRFFNSNQNASFSILVKVPDIKTVDPAINEAEGVFRPIRKLAITEENNFAVDKSDFFVDLLLSQLKLITGAAIGIGAITLLGAAIGLMNIMLVSVTERTKEIGLIKAIGGKQKSVRRQFLYEAISISLMGAVCGIILGVALGNVFSMILSTGFVLPIDWLAYGIGICFITGLLAGLYPAFKAGSLNPIEALRYE